MYNKHILNQTRELVRHTIQRATVPVQRYWRRLRQWLRNRRVC